MMFKVGLTGGIGSGKTLICDVFEHLGIPCYNADKAAKYLLEHNHNLKQKIIKDFGENIYNKQGLDKQRFAGIIFNDKKALEKVNGHVHPLVLADFERWATKKNEISYVILESAILYESGWKDRFDSIIAVYADQETRIKRIMKRDYVSREQVLERIQNQIPEEDKKLRADKCIDNNGKLLILPQVLEIHEFLINK